MAHSCFGDGVEVRTFWVRSDPRGEKGDEGLLREKASSPYFEIRSGDGVRGSELFGWGRTPEGERGDEGLLREKASSPYFEIRSCDGVRGSERSGLAMG